MSQYPHGQDRPRQRRVLPWLLGGGAVLLAGIVVLVVVLTSGPDTSTPRGVAEAVVDALNDKEFSDIVDLACADYREELGNMVARDSANTAELAGVDTKSDDEASATITLGGTTRLGLGLRKEQGQWCVSWFE